MSSQLGGMKCVAMEAIVCDIYNTIVGLCLQCYQHHSLSALLGYFALKVLPSNACGRYMSCSCYPTLVIITKWPRCESIHCLFQGLRLIIHYWKPEIYCICSPNGSKKMTLATPIPVPAICHNVIMRINSTTCCHILHAQCTDY